MICEKTHDAPMVRQEPSEAEQNSRTHQRSWVFFAGIIGEYSSRIDNADELLEAFLESFYDEPVEVQLQLLR